MMPHPMRAPSVPMGLAELVDEFRRLDGERRRGSLIAADAERYRALFARLSDALAAGQRHRRVDARQFLRVPFDLELGLRHGGERLHVPCHNFGGGGCAIVPDEPLADGDELWIDGATIEGRPHPLSVRALVAWVRLDARITYGLRFVCDRAAEREAVDRLFYRLLDRFLRC
jgi:hypothetical protein